jgi:hypothetical protein
VNAPVVSAANAYEGNNPATQLIEVPLQDSFPTLVADREYRLKVSIGGTINWDGTPGCSGWAFNFNTQLRYSLDGGTTFNTYNYAIDVLNGGTDVNVPLRVRVRQGERLAAFQLGVRFQQAANLPANCVSRFVFAGVLDVMEQTY